MIAIEKYNLTVEDDIVKLGADLSLEFIHHAVVPIAHNLSEEYLAIFFAAVLGGPTGAMFGAIGIDASNAVLDYLKEQATKVAHDNSTKTKH